MPPNSPKAKPTKKPAQTPKAPKRMASICCRCLKAVGLLVLVVVLFAAVLSFQEGRNKVTFASAAFRGAIQANLDRDGFLFQALHVWLEYCIELPLLISQRVDRIEYLGSHAAIAGAAFPFHGGMAETRYTEVLNILRSEKKKGYFLAAQPVQPGCMPPTAMVYTSDGPKHAKMRHFVLTHIPMFSKENFAVVVTKSVAERIANKTSTMADVTETVARSFFAAMFGREARDEEVAVGLSFLQVGVACALGPFIHKITFGTLEQKVIDHRLKMRGFIADTPNYKSAVAAGKADGWPEEEVATLMADMYLQAGSFGLVHLVTHTLQRIWDNPAENLPLWEKSAQNFIVEAMRLDPAVVSSTVLFGKDTVVEFPKLGSTVTYKATDPKLVVLSAANRDPVIFGGPTHSQEEANRFNPDRENLDQSLSWNVLEADVIAGKTFRACPARGLTQRLGKQIIETFARSSSPAKKPSDEL